MKEAEALVLAGKSRTGFTFTRAGESAVIDGLFSAGARSPPGRVQTLIRTFHAMRDVAGLRGPPDSPGADETAPAPRTPPLPPGSEKEFAQIAGCARRRWNVDFILVREQGTEGAATTSVGGGGRDARALRSPTKPLTQPDRTG